MPAPDFVHGVSDVLGLEPEVRKRPGGGVTCPPAPRRAFRPPARATPLVGPIGAGSTEFVLGIGPGAGITPCPWTSIDRMTERTSTVNPPRRRYRAAAADRRRP